MNQLRRTAHFTVCLAMGAFFSTAHAQDTDALVGTWMLNVERSTFAGAGLRSGTRVLQQLGDGTLYLTEEIVDAQGRSTGQRALLRRDGRDHRMAVRRAAGDVVTIAFRVISQDPYVIETVRKRNGAVIATSEEALAPDGQTCIVTTRMKERDGASVEVWERQWR